jgi:hypothetical protein
MRARTGSISIAEAGRSRPGMHDDAMMRARVPDSSDDGGQVT